MQEERGTCHIPSIHLFPKNLVTTKSKTIFGQNNDNISFWITGFGITLSLLLLVSSKGSMLCMLNTQQYGLSTITTSKWHQSHKSNEMYDSHVFSIHSHCSWACHIKCIVDQSCNCLSLRMTLCWLRFSMKQMSNQEM